MALSHEAELKLFSDLGFSVATEVINLLNGSSGSEAVFSSGTNATHLGFFGATAVVQNGAYTQTYSTATRTHSALTSAALTDNTGGTPGATLAAIAGSTYATDAPAIKNALSSLAAQVNDLIADLTNAKGLINSLINDAGNYGLHA